jgi:hypothetical protein
VILPGAGHGLLADIEPVRSLVLEHLRRPGRAGPDAASAI